MRRDFIEFNFDLSMNNNMVFGSIINFFHCVFPIFSPDLWRKSFMFQCFVFALSHQVMQIPEKTLIIKF